MASILLVDDDDAIRRLGQRLLARAGHEVREARNGNEALALYGQVAADVVILDLIMPDKEGLETIRELRRQHPGVKIVAMSGGGRGSAEDYLQLALMMGARRILPKPFSKEELYAAVDALLAA